jgi:hypothetical protein
VADNPPTPAESDATEPTQSDTALAQRGRPDAARPAQPEQRADAPPLMTLSEIAAMTGRPLAAVRAAVRRDLARTPEARRLHIRRGNDGKWLLAAPAEWLAQADAYDGRLGQPTPAQENRHAGLSVSADELAAPGLAGAAAELSGRLADIERAVADAAAQLASRVAELERQLATAQIEAAVARAERDAARQLVERVEAELKRARLPWWRRLAGG